MSNTETITFETNFDNLSHNSGFNIPNYSLVQTSDIQTQDLNIPYTVLEILVAVVAIIGNSMVIVVFQKERRLRRRTNYYIVALALADLLVGLLGVPFAILASIGLPTNLYSCLFTVSLLIVLCTISIFCLVAVSVDRYWAILYPLAYSQNVSTKTAIVIISFCWFLGSIVGFLPIFGWHVAQSEEQPCLFVEVMDYNYLVFLYVATIITPAIVLFAFYVHIYTVIIRQVRQTVAFTCGETSFKPGAKTPNKPKTTSGTMLRVLGAARKREVKATQNLSIIVLFFMLCWLPLYTINCIKAFCPDCYIHPRITFGGIILSHLNSAVNPLLYAYNLKDFRAALRALIYKMVCKEVKDSNINYRFSIASQHRLQALIDKPTTLRPRIYVDSPVWLHQQQKHHSFDSTVPKNQPPIINRANSIQVWNIAEVSSMSESSSTTNNRNMFMDEFSHSFKLIDKRVYASNTDKREYSFNYDHLDKDGSCTNSSTSPGAISKTPILKKTKITEPKLTLSISLDNLPSILYDPMCDLQQINLSVNVKLESRSIKSKIVPQEMMMLRQKSLPCRWKAFSVQNINKILGIESIDRSKNVSKNSGKELSAKDLLPFQLSLDETSDKNESSTLKRIKSDSECSYDHSKSN